MILTSIPREVLELSLPLLTTPGTRCGLKEKGGSLIRMTFWYEGSIVDQGALVVHARKMQTSGDRRTFEHQPALGNEMRQSNGGFERIADDVDQQTVALQPYPGRTPAECV